jgi:hypothetical protein
MPQDMPRSPEDGVSLPESTLTRALATLAGAGSGNLPTTLVDLERAGLPSALLDELRALVAAGHAEADVVRALYEALAVLMADGTIAAPVSRQFVRRIRNQFADPNESGELRARVRQATRIAAREPVVPHE